MATIQQNNIDFTNVNADSIFMVSGKFSKSDNNDGTAHFDTTLGGNQIAKSFNAVEIDWNGAKPYIGEDDGGITTTGELLYLIKQMYNKITTLEDQVTQLQAGMVTVSNALVQAMLNERAAQSGS